MSRRIVFAGSLQTRALARIYRNEVAGMTGDDVIFIGTGAVNTDAARSTLLLADVVAMEVDEDGDSIPAAGLPGRADVVRIPNLYCDFLWPFAGRAHPRNRGAFALPGGPYPAEHGDRFLDQLASDGVSEDEAVARYLAMDVVQEGELDSRLQERLGLMAQFDAASGFDLAGFVRDRFRVEPLFRTRQRMTMPLLRRVVEQLFAKLGLPANSADGLRRVPFPAGAQPIHPGVIAHFGLTWASADTRYPMNEEGAFSFTEFCRRYYRFAWNETLHRGIQAAKADPASAVADLEAGLRDSPESPLGRLALRVARGEVTGGAALIDEDSYDPAEEAGPVAPAEAAMAGEAPHAAPRDDTPDDTRDDTQDRAAPDSHEASTEAASPFAKAGYTHVAEEDLIAAAAPQPAHAEDDLIAAAAPEPAHADEDPTGAAPAADEEPPVIVSRFAAPPKPAAVPAAEDNAASPEPGSVRDGFTDWTTPSDRTHDHDIAAVTPGNDLIEVLPRLLPAFSDLSASVDRPFESMPEVMPPPPLRPILPPELQGEAPKQGFLARMLGKK